MIGLLYKAASGMPAQQVKMDVAANNIANVNTSSYKQDRASFADLVYQETGAANEKTGSASRPSGNARQQAAPANRPLPTSGQGVRVGAVTKDFSQGALEGTGRALDLAIDGAGFFKVTSANGQDYYTRDGSFYINKDGSLTLANGCRLAPKIDFPQGFSDVRISADGLITYTEAPKPTDTNKDTKKADADRDEASEFKRTVEAGQIQLYTFANPDNLIARGDNLFAVPTGGENPKAGHPGEGGTGLVRQGHLERSNVDMIREMSTLIEVQRAYQVSARSIRTVDEMWNIANNLYRE